MKKHKFSTFLIPLFICLALSCAFVFLYRYVSAEAKDSGALVLSIDDVTVAPGKTAVVAVEIVSNPGIMSLELTPVLPECFSFKSIRAGEILPIADSGKQVVFFADNDVKKTGLLFTIEFLCPENIQPGSYPLEVKVRACGNYNEKHIPVRINVGTIKVVNSIDSDDYFLYKQENNGKQNVLAGVKGTLHRKSSTYYEALFDVSIDDKLTDGVIAAGRIPGETGKKVCLDEDVLSEHDDVKNIRFSGLKRNYVYAVGFFNLNSVTVDSFDLYYCEPSVRGNTIDTVRVDNSISIIVSTDNCRSYRIVYDTKSAGFEKQPTEEVKIYSANGTDLKYYYRVARIQLDEPIEGVTDILFASEDNAPLINKSGNISEISAYTPGKDADKPIISNEPASAETFEPVVTETPQRSNEPGFVTGPTASETPDNGKNPEITSAAESPNSTLDADFPRITSSPCGNEGEPTKKEYVEEISDDKDENHTVKTGYLIAVCAAVVCLAAVGTGTVLFLRKRKK